MERAIVWFRADQDGDWIAELSCGHRQHVRHRPPFQPRPWVTTPEGRASRLGLPLGCPLCDRAELPEKLQLARTTATWDEESIPAGLRRDHRLAAGTWALLRVLSGRVRFVMAGDPGMDVIVAEGSVQPVPPEARHRIEPIGPVQISLTFLAVPSRTDDPPDAWSAPDAGEGGDPACWAGLVCEECGAFVGADPHRLGCPGSTGGTGSTEG